MIGSGYLHTSSLGTRPDQYACYCTYGVAMSRWPSGYASGESYFSPSWGPQFESRRSRSFFGYPTGYWFWTRSDGGKIMSDAGPGNTRDPIISIFN
jgi:hypothetical protein